MRAKGRCNEVEYRKLNEDVQQLCREERAILQKTAREISKQANHYKISIVFAKGKADTRNFKPRA